MHATRTARLVVVVVDNDDGAGDAVEFMVGYVVKFLSGQETAGGISKGVGEDATIHTRIFTPQEQSALLWSSSTTMTGWETWWSLW